MSSWLKVLILCSLGFFLEACTGVKFEAVPSKTCQAYANEFGGQACRLDPNGFNQFNYSVQIGAVDILFVDDNSGSMYPEQSEMANRFPGFLDSIYKLDYRLGIITTDIVNNGGGLLNFPNGQKTIANSSRLMDTTHSQNIDLFQQTIKRSETLLCNTGSAGCPSSDERGIYALNLAMTRADTRPFFRPGGHLAVVILSDEDERSNGGNFSGYGLETNDLPRTFVENTKKILGASKSVSVHSIIVRPGDQACFDAQIGTINGKPIAGFYGTQYAALSNPDATLMSLGNISSGVLGSICSTNYTTELGNIASKINQTLGEVQLPCAPVDGLATITFDPPSVNPNITIDSSNRLHLTPAVPAGTTVHLNFKCKF